MTFTYAVTVDLVILGIKAGALRVLLVRRGIEPFMDQWALPGGYVLPDEDLHAAARRELAEETGLVADYHLEQLCSYGAVDRDPRGRTITVAWIALTPTTPPPTAGSDAAAAAWIPVNEALSGTLAFDHHIILNDALARIRAKLEYSNVATALCPPEFSVAQLRTVYEIVWETTLDARNFHRKVTKSTGFLTPTGQSITDGGRPALLYRRGPQPLLNPPITR